MRQKLVVYSGVVEITERPGVVVKDPLLVKPLYTYVGDVEEYIIRGEIPVNTPIVLGSVGVVRVIETRNETEYAGKVFTVSPFGEQGILGVKRDGLLANYTSIHPSYLDETLVEPRPIDSIKPLIKHAYALAERASEPVLIEGCGLLGVAVGLVLRQMNIEPGYYCEEASRIVYQQGFNVYRKTGELPSKWNTIILTSGDCNARYKILENVEYRKLLVSPFSFTTLLPLGSSREFTVSVIYGWGTVDNVVVKRVLGSLARSIKVIEIDDLDKTVGLFPPSKPGFILSLGVERE